MGGRGSLESRGSRQKNALLSAGLIAILGELYGDQFQTLILACLLYTSDAADE